MLYYFFQRDINDMIILPQIQTFREEYDKDAYDSIYNINFNHIVKPLEFEPKLGDFVLNREAVATDILDCIMLNPHFGLLCNEKVLKILKRHKLPNFKIYEASIYDYNGKRLRSKYYWIHIICSLAERINFKASSFKIVTRRGIKKGNITINSEEELKEKKKVINYFHYIRIDKAYFNQKVDYDILRLGLFDIRLYLSERLKTDLIENKVSGVKFIQGFEALLH